MANNVMRFSLKGISSEFRKYKLTCVLIFNQVEIHRATQNQIFLRKTPPISNASDTTQN